MCRRTISFRGLLSSGWLQERRDQQETNVTEELFQYYFDEWIDAFIGDNEEFGVPPKHFCRFVMSELQNMQTTINIMWDLGYTEDEIEDFVAYSEWFSPKQKNIWFHDPIVRWFTRYPDRLIQGMLAS
jgi:hypothetical protein